MKVCTSEDACRYARVSELFVYEKFNRVPAETVEAGDICAVCGIDDIQVNISTSFKMFILHNFICPRLYLILFIQIGETIADKISGRPLPAIRVEEPTVRMAFSINTSPFVGREVYLVPVS